MKENSAPSPHLPGSPAAHQANDVPQFAPLSFSGGVREPISASEKDKQLLQKAWAPFTAWVISSPDQEPDWLEAWLI